MNDWRLTFYRGEASLVARGLPFGPATVEQAVLRLVDVDGPVELSGGIEPFAHHRTALVRLELSLDPQRLAGDRGRVRWESEELVVERPGLTARIAFERLGDRGLCLLIREAWTTALDAGGAWRQTAALIQETFGGRQVEDPVDQFARRGLVEAGRKRTRVGAGRSGWSFESDLPVYIFDLTERPGARLPVRNLPEDFRYLERFACEADLEEAAIEARRALVDGGLSGAAAAVAADLLAERVDALELLRDLGDQLDPLAQRLVEARRDPRPETWRAAAQAAREAGYDFLEYGCCVQALGGDEPSTFRLPVVERLLELDLCTAGELKILALAARDAGARRLAISILRRIVALGRPGEAVEEIVQLGELHLAEGNRPRAKHYFALALTVVDDARALEGAAWIALEDQDSAYALACLERAARHSDLDARRRATHWRSAARLRFEAREDAFLAASINSLKEASKLDPAGQGDDLVTAATWARGEGDLEKALVAVERRLELPGEAAVWELEAAGLLLELGRPAQAAAAAGRATVNAEVAPAAYPVLVKALRQSARDESLPSVIRDWFAVQPDSIPDGDLHLAVHALQDRAHMAETLVRRRPAEEGNLLLAVVEARLREGDLDCAGDLLRLGEAFHGETGEYWNVVGRWARASDELGQVVHALRREYDLDPRLQTALELAKAHEALGDFEEAIELTLSIEGGELEAARLCLERLGQPDRTLELIGEPDRSRPEQLLLGERAALSISPQLARDWMLAVLDLGADREGDPQRLVTLAGQTNLDDEAVERLVLSTLEREGLQFDLLRRLLEPLRERGLALGLARVLDQLRDQDAAIDLDLERLDLALAVGDAKVAEEIVGQRYLDASLVEEDPPTHLDRLKRYLALMGRVGDPEGYGRELERVARMSGDAYLMGEWASHLKQSGEPAQAASIFLQAYELEPDRNVWRHGDWLESARAAEGSEALEAALHELAPSLEPEVAGDLMVDLAHRMPAETALPWWRKAWNLDPDNVELHRRYATAAVQTLAAEEAAPVVANWIGKAEGDEPPEGMAWAVKELVHDFEASNDAPAALELSGQASRHFPSNQDLAAEWLRLIDAHGTPLQAAEIRDEVGRAIDESRGDRWLLEAEEAFSGSLRQPERALDLLAFLVERRPEERDHALRLERLAAQLGRWSERMEVGELILERDLDPAHDAERRRAMADVAAERFGQPERALALLRGYEPANPAEAAEITERTLEIAQRAGDRETVIELLDRVEAEAQDDLTRIEALLRRAPAHAQLGHGPQAFADLRSALDGGADRVRVAASWVEIAEQLGDHEEKLKALEIWSREVAGLEERAAILYRMAEALMAIGRSEEAIPHLYTAMREGSESMRRRAFNLLYPELALRGARAELGEVLATHAVEMEDRLAAAALLASERPSRAKALRLAESLFADEIEPGLRAAAGWLAAEIHEASDRPGEAADQLALLRLRGEDSNQVRHREAQLRLAAGQPGAAYRLLQEGGIEDVALSCQALESLGRWAEAEELLVGRTEADLVLTRARLLADYLGRSDESVDLLRALLDREPDHIDAVRMLERLGMVMGEPALTAWARERLADLLASDPVLRATWLRRAAELSSDPGEALSFLSEARTLNPLDDDVAETLGKTLVKAGERREAAEVFEELAERQHELTDRVRYLLKAADALSTVDPTGSRSLLARLEAAVPEDERVLGMLADLARAEDDVDEEVSCLRRLAKVTGSKERRLQALRRAAELSEDAELLRLVVLNDPEDLSARLALARVAERGEAWASVIQEYIGIAELQVGQPAAAALHRAAMTAWHQLGDRDRAIELLGEALECLEDISQFPQAFLDLADIYSGEGDEGAAAAVLAPLVEVVERLDLEIASRVIQQVIVGDQAELAFPALAELEEQYPDNLPIQKTVMSYLRQQGDWEGLSERLAWVGAELGDHLSDLEICAMAEQGQLQIEATFAQEAHHRVVAAGGVLAHALSEVAFERVPMATFAGEDANVVHRTEGPMHLATTAPMPADDLVEDYTNLPESIGTASVLDGPERGGEVPPALPSEALAIETEAPPVAIAVVESGDAPVMEAAPLVEVHDAGEPPPVAELLEEGPPPSTTPPLPPMNQSDTPSVAEAFEAVDSMEDPPLNFDWEDGELPPVDTDELPPEDPGELVVQAIEAENQGDLQGALALLKRAVHASGDDEIYRDEVSMFLSRHPDL
ncbi:MAG: hypothetical protein CMH55_05665 [Myxococcales bacterium]|nr:hypothetical protein [Myxococcales bacterium]